MGDSLNNEGSHNIIEPLALLKPVIVGPSIWGIEYPALEALDFGIIKKIREQKELVSALVTAYKNSKKKKSNSGRIAKMKKFYVSNQ